MKRHHRTRYHRTPYPRTRYPRTGMRLAAAFTLALLLAGLGCVIRTENTIDAHITLDIRHIEDDAEEILKFICGETDTLEGINGTSDENAATQEDSPPDQSSNSPWRVLDWLNPMPAAYAAELKSSSPLVNEIAVKLRERNDAVVALKRQGCLGENNRGYVALRECDALEDTDKRNEAQKQLAEENKDRKALYKEIARLNKDQPGLTVSTVESIYAAQRLKRAKPGEIFQLPPAGEYFDEFKASQAGKTLGAKCVPEAWVTIP